MAASTPEGTARRRKILQAGVRSHNRFYGEFAKEVRAFNATRTTGQVLTLLQRSLGEKSLCDVAYISLAFEVDLGARRPDCVCVFEFSEGGATAGPKGVCVILEIKTCKFASASESLSKREQRATGMKQLRDSLRLLLAVTPPGADTVSFCPVLLFISQRTLRATRITRLAPRAASGNLANLVRTLRAVSTYAPPKTRLIRGRASEDRGRSTAPSHKHRRCARKRPTAALARAGPEPPASATEASSALRPPPFPHEIITTEAVLRERPTGPSVLQKIAALFCLPAPREAGRPTAFGGTSNTSNGGSGENSGEPHLPARPLTPRLGALAS
ncbi:nuclear protein UL24 [Saimiriine alphaherpesvirus 1]|uniref:Nuclear protein UL24 n=1 Tax=Saimiriine herpesvirus 1 (strain MV-5-4-PSL) TaxID=10353 RepID=E2IUE6_SHV1|nr:nuclear protein UL24 [Saimiriine alphaherpesvirus 1]ADO13804.1 nuclear protein UL24 [Saimiriine alphaherpesvirus 1]